jgi:putative ABC transport system permease protein
MPAKRYRIHLAWLQLSWDKFRLAAALAGIVFAVALMLIQLGFRDALYRVATQIHMLLRADLVMTSTQYEYINQTSGFSRRYLYRALEFPGVESVAPIHMGMANWKSPANHRDLPIFVIGFDPTQEIIDLPTVNSARDKLKISDNVLFDEGSKPNYGHFTSLIRDGGTVSTEVSGHRVQVVGDFLVGISFASDGTLITSDRSFLRIVPGSDAGVINLGLIRLKPGTNAEEFRREILPILPPGVQVLTIGKYMDYERNYWATRTPIGFVFNMGTFVGFLVGAVIVYQILYTDVTDHLGEYATLKAMGYTDRYLSGVVVQEGLILAVLGFIPGWMFSIGMGILTRRITLLPSYMTWQRTVTVLTLTIVMCAASGMLAMQKLRSADPAENF